MIYVVLMAILALAAILAMWARGSRTAPQKECPECHRSTLERGNGKEFCLCCGYNCNLADLAAETEARNQ